MRSCYLMGTEFQSGKMEKVLEAVVLGAEYEYT